MLCLGHWAHLILRQVVAYLGPEVVAIRRSCLYITLVTIDRFLEESILISLVHSEEAADHELGI